MNEILTTADFRKAFQEIVTQDRPVKAWGQRGAKMDIRLEQALEAN